MHLRDAGRQIAEQVPQEPAQGLVRQRQGSDDRRRPAGDVPSDAPAAGGARNARLRLHADLCLPPLDGSEYTSLPNRSTAILGFVAGKFDITFPTEVSIPLLKDVKAQAPNAVCVLEQTNVATNLIINRDSAPFNDAEVRRAVALSLDRKSFINIMFEGNSDLGGAMLPPPSGVWGLPPEELKTVIGY